MGRIGRRWKYEKNWKKKTEIREELEEEGGHMRRTGRRR